LDSLGLIWTHLDSVGFTCIHLGSFGLTWTQMDSLELTWPHLDSLGFTWTHLDSHGLTRREGKGKTERHRTNFCLHFHLAFQRAHARTNEPKRFQLGSLPLTSMLWILDLQNILKSSKPTTLRPASFWCWSSKKIYIFKTQKHTSPGRRVLGFLSFSMDTFLEVENHHVILL
jgi:hypothetical protein